MNFMAARIILSVPSRYTNNPMSLHASTLPINACFYFGACGIGEAPASQRYGYRNKKKRAHSSLNHFNAIKLNRIGIWLGQNDEEINQKTDGQNRQPNHRNRQNNVQDTHPNASFVEFMTTNRP